MLESVYSSQRKREESARCWLGDPLTHYLESRVGQGYARACVQGDASVLRRFAAFVEDRGRCRIHEIPQWIEPFANQYQNKATRDGIRWLIKRFVKHLRAAGSIPAHDPGVPAPRYFKRVAAYQRYLRDLRGLNEKTIEGRTSYCLRFMQYVYNAGVKKFRALSCRIIHEFVREEGKQYSRITMVSYCSILRNFLAYLYASGQTKVDFSTAVVAPKTYRHERCPRFLPREDIEAMLKTVNRTSAIGRRNYAMLLLLSTYGLRGIEAVQMRLDDVEWRAEKLHIRARKGGRHSVYPLTPAVADALVVYLREGRPESRHREIFLTQRAPFRPIQTVAVRHVVKKHLKAAGRDVRGVGAHTLRYSCAQRLFENDFSIKVIGDYLGHRHLGTTQRYIKIDIKSLRSVAINDGEAML
jgi:integrase/recombinase XerD